jgi:hypothetical protein
MRESLRSHLTYANVMATLAVFLVLGGGAYAAFQLPKNSVRSKNVINGQVNGKDVKESSLGQVPSAAQANPVAFANINHSGTVRTNSRGVAQANVTHPFDGTYCFKGLGFTPKGAQVTIDENDSSNEFAQFGLGVGSSGCATGTQAFVLTNNPQEDAGFFVMFY